MAKHAHNTGAPFRAPFHAGPPAVPVSPFRIAEGQYRAAVKRFNNLPEDLERSDKAAFKREEAAFLATVDAVDSASPADWNEFAAAFEIACDEGQSLPSDHLVLKLLADVRRLSVLDLTNTADLKART